MRAATASFSGSCEPSPRRTSTPERSTSVSSSAVARTEATPTGRPEPASGATALTAAAGSPVSTAPTRGTRRGRARCGEARAACRERGSPSRDRGRMRATSPHPVGARRRGARARRRRRAVWEGAVERCVGHGRDRLEPALEARQVELEEAPTLVSFNALRTSVATAAFAPRTSTCSTAKSDVVRAESHRPPASTTSSRPSATERAEGAIRSRSRPMPGRKREKEATALPARTRGREPTPDRSPLATRSVSPRRPPLLPPDLSKPLRAPRGTPGAPTDTVAIESARLRAVSVPTS